MPLPYKKVVVVGATSGIGAEFAERLVEEDVYVIATGRREDRLKAYLDKVGSSKASTLAFDIADVDKAPSVAAA